MTMTMTMTMSEFDYSCEFDYVYDLDYDCVTVTTVCLYTIYSCYDCDYAYGAMIVGAIMAITLPFYLALNSL